LSVPVVLAVALIGVLALYLVALVRGPRRRPLSEPQLVSRLLAGDLANAAYRHAMAVLAADEARVRPLAPPEAAR
jgi:hypothetical protein